MSLFGNHGFISKVGHVFKGFGIAQHLGKKLGGGIMDFLFGGKSHGANEPKQPAPVKETPIQTPTQQQIGSPLGKSSDVGLGDVTSIFDDEKDPFKKLLG